MKLDPDFLFFDDPLTWRRTINSEEFNTDMSVFDFMKLYESKKIKTKIKVTTFPGMLSQEDLNNLLNS
jgi:hypothetical protein